MAQLIKLKDCISRYEWNAFRYPSQYIRLKRTNWEKLYRQWEARYLELSHKEEESEQSSSTIFKWPTFLKKGHQQNEEPKVTERSIPTTKAELKQYFLDELFPIQLKWATSTVTDVSFVDQHFETDPTLRYFLQRFPDIYLLMYFPVFNIKDALVDGEIIMISPLGIEIIHLLEEQRDTMIIASDERLWTYETGNKQSQKLSPVISLRRTEQIIKSILTIEK